MLADNALSKADLNLELSSGTVPPSLDETVSSLIRREKIYPFLASCLPFLCLIFAHLECPAITNHPYQQQFLIHLIDLKKLFQAH